MHTAHTPKYQHTNRNIHIHIHMFVCIYIENPFYIRMPFSMSNKDLMSDIYMPFTGILFFLSISFSHFFLFLCLSLLSICSRFSYIALAQRLAVCHCSLKPCQQITFVLACIVFVFNWHNWKNTNFFPVSFYPLQTSLLYSLSFYLALLFFSLSLSHFPLNNSFFDSLYSFSSTENWIFVGEMTTTIDDKVVVKWIGVVALQHSNSININNNFN